MSTIEITRRMEFDAGHRVLHHEGKCKHLHGHRYRVDMTVTAPGLDSLGRVIDFGVVKEIVGGWIDYHWDHNLLLHPHDPLLTASALLRDYGNWKDPWAMFDGKEPYIMSNIQHGNPTAENIAWELHSRTHRLLPPPITITRIRVYETPNCYADFKP